MHEVTDTTMQLKVLCNHERFPVEPFPDYRIVEIKPGLLRRRGGLGLESNCNGEQPFKLRNCRMRAPAPSGMENGFPGFTDPTFAFFQELAGNNNKMWFERNRE